MTLDYVIERLLEQRGPGAALRRLAGVRVGRAHAAREWFHVLEHKWYLSERLGRDVGLRVAAIDYFENVRPRAGLRSRLRAA